MTIYDSLIAKAIGGSGGGGGGGSSDFSTAEVTIVNNSNSDVALYPYFKPVTDHALDEGYYSAFMVDSEIGIDVYCDAGFSVITESTSVYSVYILPNKNFIIPLNENDTSTATGNIIKSYFTEDGTDVPCYIISGDCVITIPNE